ncbi:hypothetical protein HPP92_001430 [Vanilla planifolia]|uniref:Uncharacterized protein n=1 Tax=Vanilla planifolia TaxID=51239 RepID=A0A835RWQ0_VANPL|nr:hypothetical protein HPP92_001685 [Vanilla planifolia]KAG0501358.1 hypothetical protein HPP92_001430 [Vanilla planifolia]
MANNPYAFPPSSPMDRLLMQSLMHRLQLLSPSSNISPDSLHRDFLSQFGEDYCPPSDDDHTETHSDSGDLSVESRRRRTIAKEEAKLEREIIKIIGSGSAEEVLKANSGQSVTVGEHNICVGVHEESGGNYRVWEWHGHLMLFDEEDGFAAEYVYGNHFEKIMDKKAGKKDKEDEQADQMGGNSGLKDLIGDLKDSVASAKGRILHRNSLNAGSSSK